MVVDKVKCTTNVQQYTMARSPLAYLDRFVMDLLWTCCGFVELLWTC